MIKYIPLFYILTVLKLEGMEEWPGSPKQKKRVTFSLAESPSHKTSFKDTVLTASEAQKEINRLTKQAKKNVHYASKKKISNENQQSCLKAAEFEYTQAAQFWISLYRSNKEKYSDALEKAQTIIDQEVRTIASQITDNEVPVYVTRVLNDLKNEKRHLQ